jgi:transcriptional regulator with XRE-family HTH domain
LHEYIFLDILVYMTTVRDLRSLTDVTQKELARAAGTSQPTVAAYESGSKSPTLRTVNRLATSVDKEAVVVFVAPLTREDRRSLALHRAIARRLRQTPESVLVTAQANLQRMKEQHPHASSLLDEWGRILVRPVESIVETMVDPSTHARDLRHVTPFAGVLSDAERTAVYKRFTEAERRR